MEFRQLAHEEINNSEKKFPLVIIAEGITSPDNVGMIFRVSEAFGVKHIFFTNDHVVMPNKKISKISRSTTERVSYSFSSSSKDVILNELDEEYMPFALEITTNSLMLHDANFSIYKGIALVIGSEKHGVSEETLQLVKSTIAIKMFGNNTSINVVSALGICLYEITRQLA